MLILSFVATLVLSFGILAPLLARRRTRELSNGGLSPFSPREPLQFRDGQGYQLLKADDLHKFASLNAFIQKYHISRKLRIMIVQANVKTTPAMLLVASITWP